MEKVMKKYSLRDLVEQSKPQNLTNEDREWLDIEDLGEEVVWKNQSLESVRHSQSYKYR